VVQQTLNRGLVVDVVTSARAKPIPTGNMIAVTVAAAEIDTHRFVSRDLTRKREGCLQLTVAGQETAVPFAGRGIVIPDFSHRIAYLGRNPRQLSLCCAVTELDAKTRRTLDKASRTAELFGDLPNAWSPARANAGFNVASALFRMLSGLIRDDAEAVGFTVVDAALSDGQRINVTIPDAAACVLRFTLHVTDLGKHNTHQTFSVRVRDPQIRWSDTPVRVTLGNSARAGGRRRRGQRSVRDWLIVTKRLRQLNFRAENGRHRAVQSFRLTSLDHVLSWDCYELFRVSATRSGERQVLPFAISFSLNTDAFPAADVEASVRKSLDLAAALDKDRKPVTSALRKQGDTCVGLLSELLPRELLLFSFDGMLLLAPTDTLAATEPPAVTDNGKIVLVPDPADGTRWTADVRRTFSKWRRSPLGTIAFTLEAKALD